MRLLLLNRSNSKPRGWGLAWQQKSPNLIYMYVMTFDYRHLIDKSVLDILKKILEDIQSNGISDDRSIYISFRTNAQGVVLSKPVKQKYPKEITIILQHQFKNLTVLDEKFTVNITFSGITETD